jgi:hypothetical protein
MPRYGCYELRTECDDCGNPVPINGPLRKIQCSYCMETLKFSPKSVKGLLEDLVNDYHELGEREGRGGTIMSDRTYKYGYWRLPPRCRACEKPLNLEGAPEDGEIACECGRRATIYPAPDWLKELLPAERVVGGEREGPEGEPPPIWGANEAALEPIVMACPQCGGALKVSQESDRVCRCEYCETQVFIPDALWKRLHPVKKTEEWFILYADPPQPRPKPEPLPPVGPIVSDAPPPPVLTADPEEVAEQMRPLGQRPAPVLIVVLGLALLAGAYFFLVE